jgi:hypothetical protein
MNHFVTYLVNRATPSFLPVLNLSHLPKRQANKLEDLGVYLKYITKHFSHPQLSSLLSTLSTLAGKHRPYIYIKLVFWQYWGLN